MSLDHNCNVTDPPTPLEQEDEPEVVPIEPSKIVIAFQMICYYFAFLGDYLFHLLVIAVITLIFAIRWFTLLNALGHAVDLLKFAGDLEETPNMEMTSFYRVLNTANQFGVWLFAFEIISTVIVFTYIPLLHQYIMEKIHDTPTRLAGENGIMFSLCGTLILQVIFFEVHEFAYDHFIRLAAQTRLSIFYSNLINQLGHALIEAKERGQELEIFRIFQAKASYVNQALNSIVFSEY